MVGLPPGLPGEHLARNVFLSHAIPLQGDIAVEGNQEDQGEDGHDEDQRLEEQQAKQQGLQGGVHQDAEGQHQDLGIDEQAGAALFGPVCAVAVPVQQKAQADGGKNQDVAGVIPVFSCVREHVQPHPLQLHQLELGVCDGGVQQKKHQVDGCRGINQKQVSAPLQQVAPACGLQDILQH